MDYQLIAQQLGIDDPAFVERLEAARDKQLSVISSEARAWLALLPVWTVRLARLCGFPAGSGQEGEQAANAEDASAGGADGPMAALVERMRRAGLCQVEPPAWVYDHEKQPVLDTDPGNLRFSATDLAWRDLLARWGASERETLEQLLIRIGKTVGDPHVLIGRVGFSGQVPEVSRRYAEMAALSGNTADAATALADSVRSNLKSGQIGEARLWLTAAAPLSELLRNEIEAALERGKRQLLLYQRREADRAFLDKFYEREDQIVAFERLMQDPTRCWALHYRGDGGVGKTMLVRYLSAIHIPKLGASSARIDFDFLNPDYPSRAPGLLLDQFATELRLQDEAGKAGREFSRFSERVLELHERLSRYTLGMRPETGEEDKLFEELVSTFARAAAQLPQPVVLILDTCEELARLRAGGAGPANVLAAFEVLERLYRYLPTMRVVFCGRWPLAAAGAGWRAPSITLPERPYLALHEIRGFTEAEAEAYLKEREKLPPDLVAPVIKLAAETAPFEFYEWDDPHDAPPALPRCNPYRLRMFAAWGTRYPNTKREDLARLDDGRYIALRIVDHLHQSEVGSLLPAAAFLGAFDRETLYQAAGSLTPAAGDLFAQLGQQEWIRAESAGHLAVNPELRSPLLDYYRRADPAALKAAAEHGLAFLEHTTLTLSLDRLSVARFSDALRLLLENDVPRAADWWQKVEARFAQEQTWDWALQLTGQLLGSEGPVAAPLPGAAVGEGRNLLRAAVLSTYAAARLHTDPRSERIFIWNEVLDLAASASGPVAAKLKQRSLAGRVAATLHDRTPPDPASVAQFWEALAATDLAALDEQELCSWIAGVEAVMEWQERRPGQLAVPPESAQRLAAASRGRSPMLQAAAFELAGRTLVAGGRRAEGVTWLRRATELDLTAAGQVFLAWYAPAQPQHRALLEHIRGAYPGLTPPGRLASRLDVPPARNQDSAALGATIVALRGAERLPKSEWLETMQPLAVSAVDYQPEVNVHAAFPPLLAVVADELASLGDVERSLSLLSGQFSVFESTATRLLHGLALNRARLRILRRMRLQEERKGSLVDFTSVSDLDDYESRWALDSLDGAGSGASDFGFPKPPEGEKLRWLHSRWRTLYALRKEHAAVALQWLSKGASDVSISVTPNTTAEAASWWLDAVEATLLAGKFGAPIPVRPAGAFDPRTWWAVHSDQPEQALALLLRWHALGGEPTDEGLLVPAEVPRLLGKRRAAAIALDEAEMLALRLPERAAPLFLWSAEQFHACGDRLAALLTMTSYCLLRARLQDTRRLGEGLERLVTFYRAWSHPRGKGATPPHPQVPDWDALVQLSSKPDAGGLSALPDTWRPWLLRIIACHAAALGPRAPALPPLLEWLRQHYGEIPSSGAAAGTREIRFPADLEGVLPEPDLSPEGDHYPVKTVMTERERAAFSETSPRMVSVRVREEAATKRAQRVSADLTDVRLSWFSYDGVLLGDDLVSVRGVGALETGSELRLQLSQAAREILTRIAGELLTVLSIELAQRSLASVGWEGIFAGATVASRVAEPPWPLMTLRTLTDVRRRPVTAWPESAAIGVWTEGYYIREQIQKAWRQVGNEPRPLSRGRSADLRGIHVVHLVGTPKETASGVRFDLTDSYRPTRGMGSLLAAEEVAKVAQDMILCLVQTLPVEQDRHGVTDREQAALLRLFAAELHELGAPTVLVIPALPTALVGTALTPLADAINRPAEGLKPLALAQAVRAVRDVVLSDPALPPEDRLDPASDFCLYGYV